MTSTSRFGGDVEPDALTATTYTEDTALGNADFPTEFIILNGDDHTVAITQWTPTVGRMYFIYASNVDNALTITLSSGGTWDGTNDVATLDGVGEFLVVFCVAALKLEVVANPDSITFS